MITYLYRHWLQHFILLFAEFHLLDFSPTTVIKMDSVGLADYAWDLSMLKVR